jgi:hypothetical protein
MTIKNHKSIKYPRMALRKGCINSSQEVMTEREQDWQAVGAVGFGRNLRLNDNSFTTTILVQRSMQ